MAKLPIKPTAVWAVAREVKAATEDMQPILVAGTASAVEEISRALAAGGDGQWVRAHPDRTPTKYDLEGAAVLVFAVAGPLPGPDEEELLRLAERRKVPVVCVVVGVDPAAVPDVPYVLATDVVAVPAGAGVPTDAVVDLVASKLEDKAYVLAGRLPALRHAICEHIVRRFARQNGILGAAIFIPGADFPVLTLNQIRMVLRIAGAYGVELDRQRAVEILAVVATGLGLRTVARELLGLVPVGGWALKGAIAYAGTRALGEAAIRYFEAGGADGLTGSVRSRS